MNPEFARKGKSLYDKKQNQKDQAPEGQQVHPDAC
jgi:hypothetical protein